MGKLGGLAVGAEPAEAPAGSGAGWGGSISARQGAEWQWEETVGTEHERVLCSGTGNLGT